VPQRSSAGDACVVERAAYPLHCAGIDAERLRSFEIDDELQFGRKLHREVGDGSEVIE
jgi:hypothetical protein